MVPHICHWLHVVWVHHRIPVASPVHLTWLTIWPVFFSGPHVQWCTIRDACPIWEVGTTWASLAETPPHSAWLEWKMDRSSLHTIRTCGRLWRIFRVVVMGKQGATWMSPGGWVAVHNRENIYKAACISKKDHLTSFLYLRSCLLVYFKAIFGLNNHYHPGV